MSLSVTGPTLAWYVAILMGFLLLYSHAMVVAFGSQFGAFNDFFRAFYYLFGMLLGENHKLLLTKILHPE